MTHVPGYQSPNKPLQIRLHPMGKKDQVKDLASDYGLDTTALVNALLDVWMSEPGAKMPTGPWCGEDSIAG